MEGELLLLISYEVDPLCCPKCRGSMKIIAVIEQPEIIKKILQHVGLWELKSRPPPRAGPPPEQLHIDYTESQMVYSGDYCDDFVVTFPDPNLEAAIRDAISKPSGDILYSDLEMLTW